MDHSFNIFLRNFRIYLHSPVVRIKEILLKIWNDTEIHQTNYAKSVFHYFTMKGTSTPSERLLFKGSLKHRFYTVRNGNNDKVIV